MRFLDSQAWIAGMTLAGALSVAQAQPTALKTLAQAHGIDIGVAVSFPGSGRTQFDSVITRNFTGIVAENDHKWGSIQATNNNFSWTNSDRMVNFAQQHNLKLRFHAFVWHQQSSFMANGHNAGVAQPTNANAFNRTTAFQEMREHINAVMGRYKTQNQMHVISEWDVVNEAVARDSGNSDTAGLYGGLRLSTGNPINLDSGLSRWVGYTQGETNDFDYIDSAFVISHRNDTTAKLVFNDYDAEGMGKKSGQVYSLMSKLKSRNIPVHVLGMQCHWFIGPSTSAPGGGWDPQQTAQNMARIAALDLDISITELDIRFANPSDATKLQQQREAYETILSICLAQPRCKKFFVWGVRDQQSWINSRYPGYGTPLLFTGTGTTYTTKPAYDGLVSVLQTTPVSLRGNPAAGTRRRAPALLLRANEPVRDLLGRNMRALPDRPIFAVQKPLPEKTDR